MYFEPSYRLLNFGDNKCYSDYFIPDIIWSLSKEIFELQQTGRNQFRPYLFFKEFVTMEKFWNNEELEVMELLNLFTLPEKIEILKISIEQEPNPYNRRILQAVLDSLKP